MQEKPILDYAHAQIAGGGRINDPRRAATRNRVVMWLGFGLLVFFLLVTVLFALLTGSFR